MAGRDLTDGRPQVCDPLARKPVDDSRPFPPRANQPGPREHVEMLGGVRDALRDLVRDLLDGTLTLRQQVDDLRPAAATQRLCCGCERIEQRRLRRGTCHVFKLSLEYLKIKS